MMIQRLLFFAVAALAVLPHDLRAQSVSTTPAFFASVEGLNTVPDHGDAAVSWLDYRNGSYRIMLIDLASEIEGVVASPFYAEPEVVTFGDRVAWIGYTPLGVPDVYLHDRSGASTEQVTRDAAFQNHPDVGSRYLVWQEYADSPTDGSGADIRAREGAGKQVVRITDDDAYQDLPRTHGDRIVWQDFRHDPDSLDTAEIYVYDGGTDSEIRITSGSAYRTHPSIWSNLVVWEDYRHGTNAEIYLYDLSSGSETRITNNAAQQSHPAVYGRWIVWLDYRNSTMQGDLYGFNLDTGREYSLVTHPAHQDRPTIHGNHVVWQDYRSGAFDLWAVELLDPGGTDVERSGGPDDADGHAFPNPSSGTVALVPDEPFGAGDRVDVVDMLGRTVWSIRPASGARSVDWNGTDGAGRAIPTGVYVAVLQRGHHVDLIVFVRQ